MNKNAPIILKESRYAKKDILQLKKKAGKIVDIYSGQLKELFEIQNPELLYKPVEFKKKFEEFKKKKTEKESTGDWVFYPWSRVLIHTLTEKENDLLKTNRNKNIITEREQKKLREFTIGILGLSVGGNMATALLHNGFPKKFKLADFDTLETTNLNRVRARLSDIGDKKIDIIARQLYEIDPYIQIKDFSKGLTAQNVKSFVAGDPKPKLIFEIVDDFEMKILVRKEARKHKIPVVMLTSLGDSVLLDVERYDTEPKTKLFNGKVQEKILDKILAGKISEEEKHRYAVEIVSKKNLPPRLKNSIKEIGKTLIGRPQLISTVTIASGLAVLIARKIALGGTLKSGRKLIEIEKLLQ